MLVTFMVSIVIYQIIERLFIVLAIKTDRAFEMNLNCG